MTTVNQTLTVAQRERALVVASKINSVLTSMADGLQALHKDADELGALLVEAKQIVPHGQWTQWVRENVGLSLERVRQLREQHIVASVPNLKRLLAETPPNGHSGQKVATNNHSGGIVDDTAEHSDMDDADVVGDDDQDWDDWEPGGESEPAEAVAGGAATQADPESREEAAPAAVPVVSKDRVREGLQLLRAFRTWLNRGGSEDGGEMIGERQTRLTEQYRALYATTAGCMPHSVCPECHGNPVDCQVCRDRGWVPEDVWSQYSEATRRRVALIA